MYSAARHRTAGTAQDDQRPAFTVLRTSFTSRPAPSSGRTAGRFAPTRPPRHAWFRRAGRQRLANPRVVSQSGWLTGHPARAPRSLGRAWLPLRRCDGALPMAINAETRTYCNNYRPLGLGVNSGMSSGEPPEEWEARLRDRSQDLQRRATSPAPTRM